MKENSVASMTLLLHYPDYIGMAKESFCVEKRLGCVLHQGTKFAFFQPSSQSAVTFQTHPKFFYFSSSSPRMLE
jgi:hypothetical protein